MLEAEYVGPWCGVFIGKRFPAKNGFFYESSAVDADLRRAFISALAEMLWKESEDKSE